MSKRRETPRPTDTIVVTRGVVTRLVISAVGEQKYRITTLAEGTRSASLQLELPDLVMQFTSAAQVQHMRGFLAFAQAATMGMLEHHPLTQTLSARCSAYMRNTVVWERVPSATVSRDAITTGGQPIPFLVLYYDPLTLRILDLTAYRALTEAFARAHRTAVGVFPDGGAHRADPTKPEWQPDEYADFIRRDRQPVKLHTRDRRRAATTPGNSPA
ncbi:hypothetical protein [Gordonia sp. N1V]|uniref:hypothetical protein n=1 Tax=Gordonia sp. N1V TaxID=3034163 RepID=UPI0023E33813|nr:hypothetical protein [Gordonia sp. N1V]MDF3284995.1 hypothetical protein [Gordonia sp. N1V]